MINQKTLNAASEKVENVKNSGKTIYDALTVTDKDFWFLQDELTAIVNEKLVGLNLTGLPVRSRSKIVKSAITVALGYPLPKSFRKTQPRFPGQNFDVYVQKSRNLQIWNEEVDALRRYVLLIVDAEDTVKRVVVISGAKIAELDKTGTLTQKYQARLSPFLVGAELFTKKDTKTLLPIVQSKASLSEFSPVAQPATSSLLSLSALHKSLKKIIGITFTDPGATDERLRGDAVHKIICAALGYKTAEDKGTFPDIPHQLLEVCCICVGFMFAR